MPEAGGVHASAEHIPPQAASPPSDNMGVNNATPLAGKGYGLQEVRRCGTPEEYFYRLALDTLQVTLKGVWRNRDGAVSLLEKRRAAEAHKAVGFGKAFVEAPDGRRLTVFPHGGRPSYQVLMRDGDGLEVRALPHGKMPSFIIRYGARDCVENTIAELEQWGVEFAASLGFEVEKTQLSEAHIRCDTPVPFVEADQEANAGAEYP